MQNDEENHHPYTRWTTRKGKKGQTNIESETKTHSIITEFSGKWKKI